MGSRGEEIFEALPGQVINPATKSTLVRLDANIKYRLGQFIVQDSRVEGPFMKARVRYGCENAMMREEDIYLRVEDLDKAEER